MIPLKDLQPRRSQAVVTLSLIFVNSIIFLYQLSLPARASDAFVMTYAAVPSKIAAALAGHHYTFAQALVPLLTCMFLHGGWLHIVGNMWFLWVFGAVSYTHLDVYKRQAARCSRDASSSVPA